MTFYLNESLKKYFDPSTSLFKQLMELKGECFRKHKNRTTYRVQLGEEFFFIKQHRGVGWREIIKNLCQLKWPVVSAKNEWQALLQLKKIGIASPVVVGYGECGKNPATRQSFILTKALPETISLEEFCRDWRKNPPSFLEKKQLIRRVAYIANALHRHGINHRDFYLCHFLLGKEELYLIDLHRAEIRKKVPKRFLIKDLAGLYFSSMDANLTSRDYLRFISDYKKQTLRYVLVHEKTFWNSVKQRGESLYREHRHE